MRQALFVVGILVVFLFFGFMLNRSIKKHDKKMTMMKKKKGRSRYMQEYKKPGR